MFDTRCMVSIKIVVTFHVNAEASICGFSQSRRKHIKDREKYESRVENVKPITLNITSIFSFYFF